MLSVKDATAKAMESFSELYGSQFTGLMLEEVERDNGVWSITLGYDIPQANHLAALARPSRAYKVFKIDASTGEVLSMKIREAAPVG